MSTDIVDSDTADDDYIGHDTDRKHLLLKVPDYELSGGTAARTGNTPAWSPGTSKKNSYIQIGDATDQSTGTNATSGNDLVSGNINFLDDKRNRGTGENVGGSGWTAMATPPSETTARNTPAAYSAVDAIQSATGTGRNLKVTADIPNYVGWRDHTDGHRITTTRGDKIEIIGGNYKFVCLGRGTGVAAWDISGGIMKDSGEDPGNKTSVSWVVCPTDPDGGHGWKVVEQTVCANNVERFHGTVREEAYGNEFISVTGAPTSVVKLSEDHHHGVNRDALKAAVAAGTTDAHNLDGGPETYVESDSVTEATGYKCVTFNNSRGSESVSTKAYPTKWDLHCGVAPNLQQPKIYESTWAESVTEVTWIAKDSHSMTQILGESTEDMFVNKGHVSNVYLQDHGKDGGYHEYWYLGAEGTFYERFNGNFGQTFLGTSSSVSCAQRFEVYLGLEEQINIGGVSALWMGGNMEAGIGQAVEFKMGKATIDLNDTALSPMKELMYVASAATGVTAVGACLSSVWAGLSVGKRALQARFG